MSLYIPSEFADIPVTTIASNAFYGCIKLTDVTIPQSVISMGNSAFGNTNALIHLESCTPVDYVFNSNTIIVPQSALSAYREAWPEHANEIVGDGFPENLTLYVEALTDDSGIIKKIDELAEELEITELETLLSVTNLKLIGSINSYDVMVLHNKMINLTELDLSDVDIVANSYQYYSGRSTQDNKITTRFLGNFPKLQTVKLPNSAKTICSSAIEGNSPCLKFITIGSNTETIESSAFQSARTIINVKFGDNLRTIGNEAFLICTSLQTVEIGQNVSLIGYRAFEGCSELKKVTIHDDAPLVISDYAFKDCSNLNEIYLGKSTISIGNYAFQKCTSLKTAIMGEGTLSIGNCAFNECADLSNLTLGENVEIIGDFAFSGCSKIETLIIPKGVTKINQYAFSRCTGLREVRFSPGLKTIDMYAFQGCKVLQEAMLPSTVESIGANAFSGCSSLTSVKIPTSMKSIADNAFNAYKVRSVYTWTIEPTNISQNTFATDTYTKGVLYVPATAKKLYFYNTQWSRFIDIRTFDAPYQYFYLKNEDLVIDEDTPRLKGGEDETFIDDMNVDADLNTGSGLVVEGDESQNLGEVNLDSNGTDSGTILGGNSSTNQWGSNVNIDNLNIRIAITKNKWYFFCFPFDITPDMVQFDGQYVWRYYDGAERALFGHGGWKNASGTLHSGQGYIFQGSVDGTLVLNVGRAHMGAERKLIELAQHVADNLSNSSWNFVGNPYTSYYDIADLGYNAPVTIWNGNTYEAFHPDDDTKMLYPYQAFFVQKPSITDNVEFLPDFRLTLNQSKDDVYKESLHNRHQSRMRRAHANQERYIVNVDVADANDVADRTRVVFNDTRSVDYEIECDAAKFMSSSAPQLYSIGDDGTQYSINERPMGNSIVKLGFYAPADGIYTFSTSREDYEMEIVDQNNGTVTALSEGYTFYADKGTDNGRFILRAKSDVTTGIDSLIIESQEQDGIDKYDMGGLKVDDNHRGIVIEKTQSGSRRVINK